MMLIATTPYVAGWRVVETKGQVFGLVVRSRGIGGNLMAGLRSLGGGEIHEYTSLLEDTRRQAIDRMVQNATLMGANAVLSMRFDSTELANTMSEIVAYGTAVVLAPEAGAPTGAARCTADRTARGVARHDRRERRSSLRRPDGRVAARGRYSAGRRVCRQRRLVRWLLADRGRCGADHRRTHRAHALPITGGRARSAVAWAQAAGRQRSRSLVSSEPKRCSSIPPRISRCASTWIRSRASGGTSPSADSRFGRADQAVSRRRESPPARLRNTRRRTPGDHLDPQS